MDEILFRGKRLNGEWVDGDLIHGVRSKKDKIFILPIADNLANFPGCDPLDGFNVIPESVGQFTNLLNKDESKLFSGKIRLDIAGIGGGDAEIVMWAGKWQIYDESQGYYPLYEALLRNDITITQEQ